MIQAEVFLQEMRQLGVQLFSGVPCSYLTPLINTVIGSSQVDYIGAANEGDAVAVACGAELGGKHGAVLLQNSGLGNAVSPLTSLTAVFRLPALLLVTWRGHPDERRDEPQHEVMGQITPRLLELMGIPWEVLPQNEDDYRPALTRAIARMERTKGPSALIVRKGTFLGDESPGRQETSRLRTASPPSSVSPWPLDQDEVLRTVQASVDACDAVLATTGYTGRALYALADRPSQLYMVGSMGCVSSLGLGLAKVQPSRRIVVLDGDGAMLMRLGALATIGHEHPDNLTHVLLDNSVHDSTGSQATSSSTIDLAAVALACGYPNVLRVGTTDDLRQALSSGPSGLTFIHLRTKPRSARKLPRPEVTPPEVAERFRLWLSTTSPASMN